MITKRTGDHAVKTTVMGVIAMTLCRGRVPSHRAGLETFVRDLPLNTAAALLL